MPSKPPVSYCPGSLRLDQLSLFESDLAPTGNPLMEPVDRVEEDPHNPRTEYPSEAINELAR